MLVVGNTDPLFVKRALVSVHLQISLAGVIVGISFTYTRELIRICS